MATERLPVFSSGGEVLRPCPDCPRAALAKTLRAAVGGEESPLVEAFIEAASFIEKNEFSQVVITRKRKAITVQQTPTVLYELE